MISLCKRIICVVLTLVFALSFMCGCTNSSMKLPEDFSLSATEINFSKPGETKSLYEGEVPSEQITWISDNPMVATVENGTVTAKGIGSTTVSAEYFGIRYNCLVNCNLQYSPDLLPDTSEQSNYDGYAVLPPPVTFEEPSRFYNDSAFIGDSISLKLSYYNEATGDLGDALFLVSGSYGVGHAVDGTMDLYFQGQEMAPQDALAAAGVKKVFVMLGMNDIDKFGIDITMDYWAKFVANIREKNPDISICIQSMTPILTTGQVGGFTNENMVEYNERLKAFALENNCSYMDIASFLKDSDGGLAADYCSDSFVHLTEAGAYAWVQALKAYAGY